MKNSTIAQSVKIPFPDSIRELLVYYQLDLKAANKSPKTITWYLYILNSYFDFLESGSLLKPASELGRKELREYIAFLQRARRWPNNPHIKDKSKGLSPHSIQGHVRAVKAFWTWLTVEGYIPANPLIGFPLPKVPQYVVNTLSQEQLERLLKAIDSTTPLGMKYYCVMLLLLDTGMRVSELVNINIDSVDLKRDFIKIMGKGQKEREVPISRFTRKTLLKYIRSVRESLCAGESLYLFPENGGGRISVNSVQQYLRRLGKRVGLDDAKCSPHIFRHTFATQAVANGANMITLKNIMGHASLQTTIRYTHQKAEDLKAQHSRFSPVEKLMNKR